MEDKYYVVFQKIESESNLYSCNTKIPLLVVKGNLEQVDNFTSQLKYYQNIFLNDSRFHFEGSHYHVGTIEYFDITLVEIEDWNENMRLFVVFKEKLDCNLFKVKDKDFIFGEEYEIIDVYRLDFKNLK